MKAVVRRSTFPVGYPEALSLADRQAFVDFRCVVRRDGSLGRDWRVDECFVDIMRLIKRLTDREEVREALRGVVGSGREGSKVRGQAIATALVEKLWRLSSAEGAQEVRVRSVSWRSSPVLRPIRRPTHPYVHGLLQVFPIESVVHALSALGKDLPALLSDEALTRLVTSLPLLPLHPGTNQSRCRGYSIYSSDKDSMTRRVNNDNHSHRPLQRFPPQYAAQLAHELPPGRSPGCGAAVTVGVLGLSHVGARALPAQVQAGPLPRTGSTAHDM